MRTQSTYLAGAIEKASDLGVSWRNEITPFLEDLHIKVLDPCKIESKKLDIEKVNKLLPPGVKHWHALKDHPDPEMRDMFRCYMNKIIKWDLDIVEFKTDFIIAYWDKAASLGAGTHGELTYAHRLGIPVYLVTNCEVPAWLVGCSTKIFNNFDDLKDLLLDDFIFDRI